MPVPTMPRPGLVVREPQLRLGGLKRILDGPAPLLDADECLDRRPGRTPGREECEFPVSEAAADQQAARPQPRPGGAIVVGPKVGQLAISPVVEPLALGARACREPLPGTLRQAACDL